MMIEQIEPTVQNYFWIKSIMDGEINKGTNRDEFSLLKCCECFFTSFMPELTVEQVIDLMGKVVPCLSDDKSNLLMDFLFKTIRTQKEEFEKMEKINVVIKEELFEKIGLAVEKCSAYTDDADNYVRINGAIITKEAWNENYCLKVKANLYDKDDEIIHIDYDFDVKTFIEIGYETFSISCYKGTDIKDIKCVEIYPKLIKASEREND